MKKILFLLMAVFCLYSCTDQTAPSRPEIRFKNGKLKIAQLTDVHWHSNSPNTQANKEAILTILKKEQPDLLMLTGDIVTEEPATVGYEWLFGILKEAGIPYAYMNGNHDAEVMTKDSIFDYFEKDPLFVGERGPQDLPGVGNYVVPVLASDGSDKVKALLYCIDSGDYSPDQKTYGYYGWIEPSQIAWYRQQSQAYAQKNGGKPLPALAFFHIPLPEYHPIRANVDTYGSQDEVTCSPEVNTGMFFAMTEMKDVMGVFVGHDHDNDYIGQHYGIALAYGRCSGIDAGCDLERGSRIIELHEDQFAFDSWITTPEGQEYTYHYPEGTVSNADNLVEYLPALNVNPTQNGVAYNYYEGNFQYVSDLLIQKGKKIKSGVMNNFNIAHAMAEDHFLYDFNAYVYISETKPYFFHLASDDGSLLFIDNELVINNDGSHSTEHKYVKMGLEKGFHQIHLLYFDDSEGEKLVMEIAGPDKKYAPIADNVLFVP